MRRRGANTSLWTLAGAIGTTTVHSLVWQLVRRQHGVVARRQLLDLGYTAEAIRHRIESGRLHPLYRGVYAVGRRELDQCGWWMAAVLACGPGAVLSHQSAAELWGIRRRRRGRIDVSVPSERRPRQRGIRIHRRQRQLEVSLHRRIPATSPVQTLIDLATSLDGIELERAVNEADKLQLVDPEELSAEVRSAAHTPGVRRLRRVLDAPAFVLTESELEQRFVPIASRAGLPRPQTQAVVNGHRVDFWFPQLPLIVETDGLTYHRTPIAQAADRKRDQDHAAAGITVLRFTNHQVRYEAGEVEAKLAAVARRLAGSG